MTRLIDAAPGDILLDPDGDEWVRTDGGAEFRSTRVRGPVVAWDVASFDEAEEQFGPFTAKTEDTAATSGTTGAEPGKEG